MPRLSTRGRRWSCRTGWATSKETLCSLKGGWRARLTRVTSSLPRKWFSRMFWRALILRRSQVGLIALQHAYCSKYDTSKYDTYFSNIDYDSDACSLRSSSAKLWQGLFICCYVLLCAVEALSSAVKYREMKTATHRTVSPSY